MSVMAMFEKVKRLQGPSALTQFESTPSVPLKPSRTKYEYKVEEVHNMSKSRGRGRPSGRWSTESYLNSLGEEGWQMIHNDGSTATFMREKLEEEKS